MSNGKLVFNSRSETASEKPLFRDGMTQRRCLVPAAHYFEWEKRGREKIKYAIKPADVSVLYMAGIYRISYCFMDDFAGNITDIKTAALKHSIRDYLEERIQVNVQDMMDEIYEEVRMQMTDGEKRTFFDQYIKTLRMTIAADGKLSVTFKE